MKLRLLTIALLLAIPLTAYSRTHVQGIVERGAKTITVSGIASTTKSVQTYPGALVTVLQADGVANATIYSTATGVALGNPMTAGSDASYGFYLDNSLYYLRFSGTGITIPWTVGPFVASDPSDVYNVLGFGASCNGTAVDTVAIAAANTAALAAGGSVYIPPSTTGCKVGTTTISAPLKSDGGSLLLTTGLTTTITGPIDIPPQIFFRNATAGLGTVSFSGNKVVSVFRDEWWGAQHDGVIGTTGNTTSGSNVFNDSGAAFTSADIGKKIVIETTTMPRATAGFIGSISAVNSPTQIVLARVTPGTWSSTRYTYGTDNTSALLATIAVVPTNGGKILLSGISMISSGLTINKPLVFEGQGGTYPKYFLAAPTESGSDVIDFSLSSGVKLMWAGTDNADIITVVNTGGVEFRNVIIDGSNTDTSIDVTVIGLKLDRVRYLSFTNGGVVRCSTALIVGSTTSLNDGSFKNSFSNAFFQGTNGIVFNSIGAGTTGGFVNSFYNTQVEFTNIGIDFQKGDNNVFTGNTYVDNHLYPTTGTTLGVNFGTGPYGPTHAGPFNAYSCYNQYFWHLFTRDITIAAGNREAGSIDHLDQANYPATITYGAGSTLSLNTTGLIQSPNNPYSQIIGTLAYRGGISETPFVAVAAGNILPITSSYQKFAVAGGRTLPAAVGWPGYRVTLLNTSGGAVTVFRSGSDTISGATTYVLTADWKYVTVASDGVAAWVVVASN
jgi:hypothetical protein